MRRRTLSWLEQNSRSLPILTSVLGLLVAQGAPLGLLLHTYLFGPRAAEDFLEHAALSLRNLTPIYIYVWAGTSLFVSLFGFTLGILLGSWIRDLQKSQHAVELFRHFDQVRQRLQGEIHDRLASPRASLIEFHDALHRGLFGSLSDEQKSAFHWLLQDILNSYQRAESAFSANRGQKPSSLRSVLHDLHETTLIESPGGDFEVAMERSLLHAALRGLLSVARDRQIRLEPELGEENAFLALELNLRTLAGGEADTLLITRYILEWFGGSIQFSPNEKVRVLLPLTDERAS